MAKQHGITLIEMMIALGIFAILAAIAVPSYQNLIASQRVRDAATDLHTALTYARATAISRNTSVTLSAIDDDWSNGWQIEDPATTGVLLLERTATHKVEVTPDPSDTTEVVFRPSGRVDGASVTFEISTELNDQATRCVFIDPSGRPRSQRLPAELTTCP